jgi:hypothetical protein
MQRWLSFPRASATATVLVVSGVTVLCLFVVSDHLGRQASPASEFLASFRAPTFDEVQLAAAGEHALWATEKNDVVFVGDSSCRHGIDPKQLEALTGLTSYNLGVTAWGGADGVLVIALAYLANHPKPTVLVLCVAPPTFVYDFTNQQGRGPTQRRFVTAYGSRVPELPTEVLPGQDRLRYCRIGSGALWKALCRRPDVLSSRIEGRGDAYPSIAQQLAQSRGYFPLDGRRKDQPEPPRSKGPAEADSSWRRCVTALAQHCQASGIKFLIRMGPLEESLRHELDYDAIIEWLMSLARDYDCVTLPEPQLLWYDASLCWDPHHLNARGVEKFTPIVAQNLRALLAK